ncbi:Uncharacterised protein [Mycobacteroides abscessus]|nr:Uncharacterised protein [Mycobacteroides abscessus]
MPDSPWSTWAPGTRVVVRRRLSPDDAAAAGKPVAGKPVPPRPPRRPASRPD